MPGSGGGGRLAVAIVLGYCILVQSERLAAVDRDYAAETARLAKAEALLRRRDWPELLAAERATHREVKSMFWPAETEGLAQARLQAALSDIMAPLALRNPRIRSGVSQPVPHLPGVWRVQTRLDAAYFPGSELKALHALATYPEKLIVERLDLSRHERHDSRLMLILSAYFMGIETGEVTLSIGASDRERAGASQSGVREPNVHGLSP